MKRTALIACTLLFSSVLLAQDFSDNDYHKLKAQMSRHNFTITTMTGATHQGQLLFTNDSVCVMWMDMDSIVDFNRLSEKVVRPYYYYDIKKVMLGNSYKKPLFGYKKDINGNYALYKECIAKLQKHSLYRWFIPEELIDYMEEAQY